MDWHYLLTTAFNSPSQNLDVQSTKKGTCKYFLFLGCIHHLLGVILTNAQLPPGHATWVDGYPLLLEKDSRMITFSQVEIEDMSGLQLPLDCCIVSVV